MLTALANIDHGTRLPATGVLVFAWGRLQKSPAKVEALVRTYQALSNPDPARR